MELIYILESLFGKITFSIGEYEFAGCRPITYMDLPWKNEKEMDEFNMGLSKENTLVSYQKYIYLDEQFYCQKIHITFSRSFLFLIAGIILLILSAILLVSREGIGSSIALAASIIIMMSFYYLKSRANKYHTDLCMGQVLYKCFETWPAENEEEIK